MSIREINTQIWSLVIQKYPVHVDALKIAVKGMSEGELFTFLRLSVELNLTHSPTAFLEILRTGASWEAHCALDKFPNLGALEYYRSIFSEKVKAA